MNISQQLPEFARGERVLFSGENSHPKKGQYCRIIGPLPNPSRLTKNQWYDVRFDDYSILRVLGRYLTKEHANAKNPAA
jgi:hypothetical protein